MTIMQTAGPGAGDALAIMCQNQMTGRTVIAADAHRNYEIIFEGKDDPDGNDVQPIPDVLLRTVQFQRALQQGILVAVEGADHPVVVQAMNRQSDSFRRRNAAADTAARESLDKPHEEDILIASCVGPGSREGASCETQVPVRGKDSGRPPLCDRHVHLADRCVKRGNGPWTLEDEGALF